MALPELPVLEPGARGLLVLRAFAVSRLRREAAALARESARLRSPRGGGIARIVEARVTTYSDSGQRKAWIRWQSGKGNFGQTEGDPKNPHVQALLARARREGIPVQEQSW